jgi:hypothetical protein
VREVISELLSCARLLRGRIRSTAEGMRRGEIENLREALARLSPRAMRWADFKAVGCLFDDMELFCGEVALAGTVLHEATITTGSATISA